jgi:hypothetical protein
MERLLNSDSQFNQTEQLPPLLHTERPRYVSMEMQVLLLDGHINGILLDIWISNGNTDVNNVNTFRESKRPRTVTKKNNINMNSTIV